MARKRKKYSKNIPYEITAKTGHGEDNPQIKKLFKKALSHTKAGRSYEAELVYRKILELNPRHCPTLVQLSEMASQKGRLPIALEFAQTAVAAHPREARVHNVLANVLAMLGQNNMAIAEFRIAFRLDNNNSQVLNGLGNVYAQQGRFDEAIGAFRQSIAIQPTNVAPYYNLVSNKRFRPGDPDLELIDKLQGLISRSSEDDQILIYFALGKIYDDCAEYDLAFEYFSKANNLKARRVSYSPEKYQMIADGIIKTLNLDWRDNLSDEGNIEAGAIFIVGMPRSGTTLLESLLCRHPQISGIGEWPYIMNIAMSCEQRLQVDIRFPEILGRLTPALRRELGDEYLRLARQFDVPTPCFVDKTPINFQYLGFILEILPNARLVHNFRNPIDTCFSIYRQFFFGEMDFAYNLEHIGQYYLLYRKLMKHWKQLFPDKILEVDYDDVVADTELQLRRIIDFCGLSWDDACFSEQMRGYSVRTASSWQARQPIYRTSVKRWRNYVKHLGPLLEVLEPVLEEKHLN